MILISVERIDLRARRPRRDANAKLCTTSLLYKVIRVHRGCIFDIPTGRQTSREPVNAPAYDWRP